MIVNTKDVNSDSEILHKDKTSRRRDIIIDIIRGIAIILMVVGHAGFPQYIVDFIYLFHMPVFFMISGYCYNSNNSENFKGLKSFTKRQIKNIYLPAVICHIVFLFVYNIFFKLGLYTENVEFLKISGSQYGGVRHPYTVVEMLKYIIKSLLLFGSNTQFTDPLWFFQCLFIVSILFSIILYISKKLNCKWLMVLSMFFSIFIGWLLSINNIQIYGLDKLFVCFFLYMIGYIFKSINWKKLEKNLLYIYAGMFAFAFLVVLLNIGKVSIATNKFVNPIFLLSTSILGWLLLYSIAIVCKKSLIVSKILEYVGKNTRSIVFLHFISFKIITFIIVIYEDMPRYALAAFPIIDGKLIYSILYSIIGIIVPLMVSNIYMVIYKNTLKNLHKLVKK